MCEASFYLISRGSEVDLPLKLATVRYLRLAIINGRKVFTVTISSYSHVGSENAVE